MPAPRILKERTGCSSSSFSQISASPSTSSRTSGVRIATPVEHLARPPDLADRDHSETTVPASSASARRRTYSAAARSSTARPSDLKTVISSFDLRPATGADQQLADLGADVLRADRALALRDEEVAGLVQRRLAAVDEQRRARHRRRVELARRRDARPTALMCTPGFSQAALDDRLGERGRRADHVRVAHGLLGRRRALGAVEAASARAPHDDPVEVAHGPHRVEVGASLRARPEDRERLRIVPRAAGASRRPRPPRCVSR